MPPYKAPLLGEKLDTKFIRIGRNIIVSRKDYRDDHDKIARLDHLEPAIATMKATNPDEVDAGWLGVRRNGDIITAGESATLSAPVLGHEGRPREITNRDLAEQSPHHNVLGFRK